MWAGIEYGPFYSRALRFYDDYDVPGYVPYPVPEISAKYRRIPEIRTDGPGKRSENYGMYGHYPE